MTCRQSEPSTEPAAPLLVRALETMANAVFLTDADGCIVWANAAFSALSGYAPQEILGRTPSFLQSGIQDRDFYSRLWHTICAGQVWQAEVVERHRDGHLYAVDEIITPMTDASGQISHFIAVLHDVTQRRQQALHDHHLAHHDALTGLPNRRSFERALRLALGCARRAPQTLAVLFIDLDQFKPVNDRHGHAVGDLLLSMVAARLRSVLREGDMVARLGGDEFAVLLYDHDDALLAPALAGKLIAALTQPYALEQHTLVIGASIGLARFPADGDSPAALLRRADQAMYQAKAAGGNRYAAASGITPPPPLPAAG